MELEIEHQEEQQRFVAVVEGREATLRYAALDGDVLDYRSTFVPVPLRGRGIGGRLVGHALDWARDHGRRVVPSCPFVATFIDAHPEYRPLVVAP